MAPLGKPPVPTWIRYWLALSALTVLWDAGYCLLRPWSMEGGPLFPIFAPYKLYGTVDLVYGKAAWLAGDGFCAAQALMNVVEVVLQLWALRLWQVQRTNTLVSEGTFVAFSAQLLTLAKTVLYWLMDILSGFKGTRHNAPLLAFFVYYLPGSLWILFPAAVVTRLGNVLLEAVRKASAPAESDNDVVDDDDDAPTLVASKDD